eukprot:8251908-Karenia_brevis.AAC.1
MEIVRIATQSDEDGIGRVWIQSHWNFDHAPIHGPGSKDLWEQRKSILRKWVGRLDGCKTLFNLWIMRAKYGSPAQSMDWVSSGP